MQGDGFRVQGWLLDIRAKPCPVRALRPMLQPGKPEKRTRQRRWCSCPALHPKQNRKPELLNPNPKSLNPKPDTPSPNPNPTNSTSRDPQTTGQRLSAGARGRQSDSTPHAGSATAPLLPNLWAKPCSVHGLASCLLGFMDVGTEYSCCCNCYYDDAHNRY